MSFFLKGRYCLSFAVLFHFGRAPLSYAAHGHLINKERFPHLFDLAIHYLSVPTNAVNAERSVSQYTAVNAPQRQSFSDRNLALQVLGTSSQELQKKREFIQRLDGGLSLDGDLSSDKQMITIATSFQCIQHSLQHLGDCCCCQ